MFHFTSITQAASSKQQALGSIPSKVPVPGTRFLSAALATLMLLGGYHGSAVAENNTTSDTATATTETGGKTGANGSSTTFAGIKFGTGLSAAFRRHPIVSNAEVVAGVVRVTEETSAVARVILESHYLFTCEDDDKGKFCGKGSPFKSSGHGPFVALQPGQNDLIQAIGMGWMVAFRNNPTETSSWNIGLGVMVDPKVKSLGDGIAANLPLPAGETQVRFKTSARYSWFLMSSYAF